MTKTKNGILFFFGEFYDFDKFFIPFLTVLHFSPFYTISILIRFSYNFLPLASLGARVLAFLHFTLPFLIIFVILPFFNIPDHYLLTDLESQISQDWCPLNNDLGFISSWQLHRQSGGHLLHYRKKSVPNYFTHCDT